MGAPVAQWIKRRPTDLADPVLLNRKRSSIVHSLSLSTSHHPDKTEIVEKDVKLKLSSHLISHDKNATLLAPGHIGQSVGHLTRTLYPVWQHTFVSPSAFSRRAVVSYWRKYVHEVLVNRLGGLSLPSKSVVRLTDRPDMTLDVYRGRKTTAQQQHIAGSHMK